VRRLVVIVVGVVAFLAISFEVARFLTTETRERNAVLKLLQAEAKGDANGMLDRMDRSCRTTAFCQANVRYDAVKLRRPGKVKIIAYDSKTAYAFGSATGRTRVAWVIVGHTLPIVQCVTVHRGGSAIAGRSITLLAIGRRIGSESTC
jgi:hypothetical protein